ncbi:kinesin-1 [Capsaspora owczarzaki ATCC 30864]|uniref:Kinesin-1 n=1 Tax=Capsaspora owczarzaki (strain ATCC 30864) TaxID=595528 RepID=A0A0D2WWV0_CAPO3|nr:kinesin-1 [Capsaspora owczarzaki ATCC 30864]
MSMSASMQIDPIKFPPAPMAGSRIRAPTTVVKKEATIIAPQQDTETLTHLMQAIEENASKRRASTSEAQPAPDMKRPAAATVKGRVVNAGTTSAVRPATVATARPAPKAVAASAPRTGTTTTAASVSASSAAVKARIASTATLRKPVGPAPTSASAIAARKAAAASQTAVQPQQQPTSFIAPAPSAAEVAASVPGNRAAWDYKGRLEDMESFAMSLRESQATSKTEVATMEAAVAGTQEQMAELDKVRQGLEERLQAKEREVSEAATRIRELESATRLRDVEYETATAAMRSKYTLESDMLQTQLSSLQREKEAVQRSHREALDEACTLKSQLTRTQNDLAVAESKLKSISASLEETQRLLERRDDELRVAKGEINSLRSTIAKLSSEAIEAQTELRITRESLHRAEADGSSKARTIEELQAMIAAHQETIRQCEEKIREDEAIRRRLHNTVQELKGNIRVFCRVRPILPHDRAAPGAKNGGLAKMDFPDRESKTIVLFDGAQESYDGKTSTKAHEFSFDKVFSPSTSQAAVFDEMSQLVQSALDGYNVCIFAYGQTGSGKTYTMEGPALPSSTSRMDDSAGSAAQKESCGMIPRAVAQIFQTAQRLTEKGWAYEMEASYLEIYNELINDLLGNGDLTKKHDIKIRPDKPDEIYVSDTVSVKVENEMQVFSLLNRASQNRAVAETQCNSRSSRSHSVFRLKLTGRNSITGEFSEGILNLVDLAGSERLSSSGAQGDRLKETQAINKSLSHLGNVIMALANKQQHVPYRDSKLTHLLQNSLGGNSKTLMFVNISPREESLSETICSLRFATKVNGCNIGTAQKRK